MKYSVSLLVAILSSRLWVLSTQLDSQLSAYLPLLAHDLLTWSPILLWESVVPMTSRWRGLGWVLWLLGICNVLVTTLLLCHLGSPLTYSMFRAADGALLDSIGQYLNGVTLLMLASVGGAACTALWLRRGRNAQGRTLLWVSLLVLGIGSLFTPATSLRGLQRNSWTAVAETTWAAWRTSPKDLLAIGSRARVRAALPESEVVVGKSSDSLRQFLRTESQMTRTQPRNVVLVILESVAAQHLERFPEAMPFLGRLSREGWCFDRAYATYPESIKGLVALLDSQYPAIHTVAEDYAVEGPRGVMAELRSHGRRTSLFHSGRFEYLGMPSVIHGRGFHTLQDAGDISGERYSSFGVDEESTVANMVKWVQNGEEPYALCYMPIAGHHPYDSPVGGPFRAPEHGENDFVEYLNAIRYCDTVLESLWQQLDEGRDTLWVIMGDHGQAFEEHPGNTGHVFDIYDENVRVPLVFWSPEWLVPHQSSRVVSAVDVAPTLLDLLGVAIPPSFVGESLLDRGSGVALFFCDYSRSRLGVRWDRGKFLMDVDSGQQREFFRLLQDPREQANSYVEGDTWKPLEEALRDWSRATRAQLLQDQNALESQREG